MQRPVCVRACVYGVEGVTSQPAEHKDLQVLPPRLKAGSVGDMVNMRGTPQTHLLAFSFLCLLSKVRGPRSPKTYCWLLGCGGGGVKSLPRTLAGSRQGPASGTARSPSLVTRQLPLLCDLKQVPSPI